MQVVRGCFARAGLQGTLNETGHELIQGRSPERTAEEVQDPATPQPPQQQHPALEPAVPPPLPPLHVAQPPQPFVDGAGGGPPPKDDVAPMQTDEPAVDPKRKAPFDEAAWEKQLAMARASKGKGEGKGQPEKKGKTTEE